MKNNVTELVFILDKSGSMAGMEQDTVGGFNAMIERQRKQNGKAYVSSLLFSNETQVVHDRVSLDSVQPLSEKDYQVGGCTALFDAIGGQSSILAISISMHVRRTCLSIQCLLSRLTVWKTQARFIAVSK